MGQQPIDGRPVAFLIKANTIVIYNAGIVIFTRHILSKQFTEFMDKYDTGGVNSHRNGLLYNQLCS